MLIEINIQNLLIFIILPILTGILSTIFYVLVVNKLFFEIFIPWYFSKKYKSTIIEGTWEGKSDNLNSKTINDYVVSSYFKIKLVIEQKGDRIKGAFYAETCIENNKSITHEVGSKNTYEFIGEIRDGYVIIRSKEIDRKKFGINSFIFQIAGAGSVLNGGGVYVSENISGHSISTLNNLSLKRV